VLDDDILKIKGIQTISKIATFQKRFEPFWFVAASSHYVYDRLHKYRVEVAPKVHAVTVHDNKYQVMGNSIELEGVNHCTEEFKLELIVDAMNGNEVDLKKYLNLWKDKNKKKVVEFDALTGEAKFEDGAIKKQVNNVLENNTFFDFSADAAGTLIPGGNLVVKLGRMAAKKAIN